MTASSLLTGLRVLDLSMYTAGPCGAMLLADLGAEVVKVEPLGGDPTRTMHPFKEDLSLIFGSFNRNKRSVAIDLRTSGGRAVCLELAGVADVVYNNFRPGVMERLGLSFEEVKKVNPKVVYCCLSGFGLTGPYSHRSAYDPALQGISGVMSLTGQEGAPPTKAGVPIADLGGGMFAVIAVLAALRRRDETGEPVLLDVSMLDGLVWMVSHYAALYLNLGRIAPPQGTASSNSVPYGAFRTKDGWVIIAIPSEQFWPKLCRAIERHELASDPRFDTNPHRVSHKEELLGILNDILRTRTTKEWLGILEAHDVPCGPVNNVGQAMEDPQTISRHMRIPVIFGSHTFEFPANPIKTVPDVQPEINKLPLLGEHTESVLRKWLGKGEEEITALAANNIIGTGRPMVRERR